MESDSGHSSTTPSTSLPSENEGSTSADKKLTPFRWKLGLVYILVFAVMYGILKIFFGFYYIPSESMYPTIHGSTVGGDRIFLHQTQSVHNNDVIVFKAPTTWKSVQPNETLIKRVVATGGQTVSCCTWNGDYLVNGKSVASPYPSEDYPFIARKEDCETAVKSQRCFPEQHIPKGYVWVMGDNRGDSADSSYGCRSGQGNTCQGPVKQDKIIGIADAIVWPFTRWKTL